MPKPPVVWYTDSDSVPEREITVDCETDLKKKDRLSRITALVKKFENGNSNYDTLEKFDAEYQKILNDEDI